MCFPRIKKLFNNNAPPFYKSGMSSRETMRDDATFVVSQGILCCRSRSRNSNSSSIHYLTRYFAAPGLVKCFALVKYDCCRCAK